ncbi:MAG: VanW family protein [candidate division FCPU426 bacterium]
MGRTLFFASLCLLAAAGARAELLAEYSCVRPRPVDPGSWTNASLAASLLHGTVVKPGARFSFLRCVELGRGRFVRGRSLSNGRVVMSKGGGICQVSTALYNAVLLAGLSVTDRRSHSFYDDVDAYVEPGRDAAVSGSAGKDFCFENRGSTAVTISAAAVDGRVSVQVWGDQTAPPRRWLLTRSTRIPKTRAQKPVARRGFDGWRVERSLAVLDAAGTTSLVLLEPDFYPMIPERAAKP